MNGPSREVPAGVCGRLPRPGPEPAPAFEQTFLKLLPAKPEKTFDDSPGGGQAGAPGRMPHAQAVAFLQTLRDDNAATLRKAGDAADKDTLDKVYQATLTAVHDQLKAQLDDLFDQALKAHVLAPLTRASGRPAHHRRLPVQHGGGARPRAPPKRACVASPAYVRFIQVVGPRRPPRKSATRRRCCRRWAKNCRRSGAKNAANSRSPTVADRRAARTGRCGCTTPIVLLTDHQDPVRQADGPSRKNQQAKVDDLEKDLAEARDKTDGARKSLRDLSDSLHDMRTQQPRPARREPRTGKADPRAGEESLTAVSLPRFQHRRNKALWTCSARSWCS